MRHSTVVFFAALMVGKTLGKYRIVEKIGRGGMGIVYLGVDETLDRQVAIKAISPELVEEDLVRRFRAEAVTLAKVNHPNIASVYELFRDDDRLLMVMELVKGQTFEYLLERGGPMSVERAVSITGQILDALGHAHRAGIVHRDLKPANLMLTDAGIVKVMDFGIARVSGTERMTSDGLMVGTPAYMAPEQVRGEEVDGRTDLYAVGVVFYRLLTGKLPFKAESAVAMIQSQLNAQPTPAREVRSELPDWIDAVLMRSLEKRPADRYQTAEEFRRALESLEQLGALAPLPDDVTIATPVPIPAVAAASTPAASPHSTTLVLNRSHLAVALGFGAMLLIVIGLLAWVAIDRQAPVQVVTVPATAPAPVVAPSAPVVPPAANTVAVAPPPAPAPAAVAAPAAPKPSPEAAAVTSPAVTETPATPPSRKFGPGRGGLGIGPAVPEGGFKPVEISGLHAVAVTPRGTRMVETTLAFGERALTASDSRNGFTVKGFPYQAVTHVTLSRSRKPRGTGGATIELPGLPEGNIFARGPRLWVTIETADDRLILRIDPAHMRPIFELMAQRTRVSIERYMEPEP